MPIQQRWRELCTSALPEHDEPADGGSEKRSSVNFTLKPKKIDLKKKCYVSTILKCKSINLFYHFIFEIWIFIHLFDPKSFSTKTCL